MNLSTSETDGQNICPVRMRHSQYCCVTVYVCPLAAEVQCPRLVNRAEVGVCPAAVTAAVQWYRQGFYVNWCQISENK